MAWIVTAMNLKIMLNSIRKIFFPLDKREFKKFLPISLILFFMLFIYTMTKGLRDIFIQKFSSCGGTELIPVIKVFGVFPALLLFILIFEILVSKFSHVRIFNTFVLSFAIFYLIFGLILFPNLNYIHMDSNQIIVLQQSLPKFLYYMVPCFANWSFTLFYIFSEIWGSFIVPALFWQFAYKVTKKDEAKKFFGLYVLVGNIGVIVAGFALKTIIKVLPTQVSIETTIAIFCMLCSLFCLFSIYFYMNSNGLFCEDKNSLIVQRPKNKIEIFKGLRLIFKSKYLSLIFIILFVYSVSMDFVEIFWQNYLRYNLSAKDYFSVMGNFSMLVGFFTIIMSFISPLVISNFKWKTSAKITPTIMGILGFTFFSLYIAEYFCKKYNFSFAINSKYIVIIGLLAVALSRGIRYSLFDSTKNLVYLNLDSEFKTQGQAIVESLGGRIGKAGSSVINYTLVNIVFPGTVIFNHVGIIFSMFIINIFLWIKSINKINEKM